MELVELNRLNFDAHVKADFASETSEDGHISLLLENDIRIHSYKPNMDSDENKLKFNECIIKCGDFHVADHTGVNLKDVVYYLPRLELYKIISNDIFSPKFEETATQLPKPISLAWSPRGVYKKDLCALAIISNLGNVEIFIKTCEEWTCLINLTELLIKHESKDWNESIAELFVTEQSQIHMKRVLECTASCVTWSPIYGNDDKYVFVTVGYLSGDIRIWKLKTFNLKETFGTPELVATKNVMTEDQISVIHFCRTSNDTAWLICGSLSGIIKALPIQINDATTTFTNGALTLWDYADIRSSKIQSFTLKNHSFILTVKNEHIVISLLDNESQTLIKNKNVTIGNYLITGLEIINDNTFLILTMTGVMKILKIDATDSDIKFELELVKTNIDCRAYVAKGLSRSPESHMWGIVLFPSKIFDHLAILKPTEIVFCIKHDLDPGKMLKENESQHLDKHWELLEIIRCLSIEKQTLPSNWVLNCEIFDDINLYELRIMYWLTLASTKLMYVIENDVYEKVGDPELLEKFIYFKYFLSRLKTYCAKLEGGFNKHQLMSIHFMKQNILTKKKDECFKEYFSEKFIEEVDELISKIDETINVPIPDCIICDTPLATGKCDHPDDRCIISNVQIACNGKWHCKYCQGMAHEDIEDQHPYCTICDIPLLPFDPQIE